MNHTYYNEYGYSIFWSVFRTWRWVSATIHPIKMQLSHATSTKKIDYIYQNTCSLVGGAMLFWPPLKNQSTEYLQEKELLWRGFVVFHCRWLSYFQIQVTFDSVCIVFLTPEIISWKDKWKLHYLFDYTY